MNKFILFALIIVSANLAAQETERLGQNEGQTTYAVAPPSPKNAAPTRTILQTSETSTHVYFKSPFKDVLPQERKELIETVVGRFKDWMIEQVPDTEYGKNVGKALEQIN